MTKRTYETPALNQVNPQDLASLYKEAAHLLAQQALDDEDASVADVLNRANDLTDNE